MHLNITMKEDLRTLRKGFDFKFDFETPYILIVGDNGAGKSTLINIIRDFRCDNMSDVKANSWNQKLGYLDIKGFSKKADIDTDFEKIFFVSSEFDDPNALNNSASAESFIQNNGFVLRHKSNGERNFMNLGKWLTENQDQFDDKTLIIFDEADRGFDLRYQVGFVNMMNKLNKTKGVKTLAITHNVIPMSLTETVYDLNMRLSIPSDLYLELQTGYKFSVTPIDNEQRRQKNDGEAI